MIKINYSNMGERCQTVQDMLKAVNFLIQESSQVKFVEVIRPEVLNLCPIRLVEELLNLLLKVEIVAAEGRRQFELILRLEIIRLLDVGGATIAEVDLHVFSVESGY